MVTEHFYNTFFSNSKKVEVEKGEMKNKVWQGKNEWIWFL